MASSGSGYDLSASTFSPDGRIFQVEYANKAVENSGTVIAIRCAGAGGGGGGGGVVVGVGKPVLHKMVVHGVCSYKRIHNCDSHVGIASTGFIPDTRVIVARAIDECQDYLETYGSKIPPHLLADRLGYYVHYFTLHGALRPFGIGCVQLGWDISDKKPTLHMVEPNGVAYSYYGVAVGKGKQAAKTELEKLNLNKVDSQVPTTRDAVNHITRILMLLHRENKDSEGKPLDLELSWICEDSDFQHKGVPLGIIEEAKKWATQQLEEEEDDDDEEGATGAYAAAMEE